jgi:hypothetical protein
MQVVSRGESAQVSDVRLLGSNGRTELLVLKLQESLLLCKQDGKPLPDSMRY